MTSLAIDKQDTTEELKEPKKVDKEEEAVEPTMKLDEPVLHKPEMDEKEFKEGLKEPSKPTMTDGEDGEPLIEEEPPEIPKTPDKCRYCRVKVGGGDYLSHLKICTGLVRLPNASLEGTLPEPSTNQDGKEIDPQHVKKCVICGDKSTPFSDPDKLEEHLQTHVIGASGSKKPYICHLCFDSFLVPGSLSIHLEESHGLKEDPIHLLLLSIFSKTPKINLERVNPEVKVQQLRENETKEKDVKKDPSQEVQPDIQEQTKLQLEKLEGDLEEHYQRAKEIKEAKEGVKDEDMGRPEVPQEEEDTDMPDLTGRPQEVEEGVSVQIQIQKKSTEMKECPRCRTSMQSASLPRHLTRCKRSPQENPTPPNPSSSPLANIQCTICTKMYSSRYSVLRHIRNAHSKVIGESPPGNYVKGPSKPKEPFIKTPAPPPPPPLVPPPPFPQMQQATLASVLSSPPTIPISPVQTHQPSPHQITHKTNKSVEVKPTLTNGNGENREGEGSNGDFSFCPVCADVFWDRNILNQHVESLHPNRDRSDKAPPPCPVCQIQVKYAYSLRRHIVKLHTPWLNERRARFGEAHPLKKLHPPPKSHHKQMRPTPRVELECKVCREGFPSLADLQNHFKSHFTLGKDQMCPICRKIMRKSKFVGHLLNVHHKGARGVTSDPSGRETTLSALNNTGGDENGPGHGQGGGGATGGEPLYPTSEFGRFEDFINDDILNSINNTDPTGDNFSFGLGGFGVNDNFDGNLNQEESHPSALPHPMPQVISAAVIEHNPEETKEDGPTFHDLTPIYHQPQQHPPPQQPPPTVMAVRLKPPEKPHGQFPRISSPSYHPLPLHTVTVSSPNVQGQQHPEGYLMPITTQYTQQSPPSYYNFGQQLYIHSVPGSPHSNFTIVGSQQAPPQSQQQQSQHQPTTTTTPATSTHLPAPPNPSETFSSLDYLATAAALSSPVFSASAESNLSASSSTANHQGSPSHLQILSPSPASSSSSTQAYPGQLFRVGQTVTPLFHSPSYINNNPELAATVAIPSQHQIQLVQLDSTRLNHGTNQFLKIPKFSPSSSQHQQQQGQLTHTVTSIGTPMSSGEQVKVLPPPKTQPQNTPSPNQSSTPPQKEEFFCQHCVHTPFKRRDTLAKHVRVVHEGQRWRCVEGDCSREFRGRESLVTHLQREHQISMSNEDKARLQPTVTSNPEELNHPAQRERKKKPKGVNLNGEEPLLPLQVPSSSGVPLLSFDYKDPTTDFSELIDLSGLMQEENGGIVTLNYGGVEVDNVVEVPTTYLPPQAKAPIKRKAPPDPVSKPRAKKVRTAQPGEDRAKVKPKKKSEIILEEGQKFSCNFPGCEKLFARESWMRSHYRMVHEATQSTKIVCSHCGQTFFSDEYYKVHLKSSHPGEIPQETPPKQ